MYRVVGGVKYVSAWLEQLRDAETETLDSVLCTAVPCAHRRSMWTDRARKITHEGASASSCELDHDDCRSRTTPSTLDDDLDDDLNAHPCQEDSGPYTYDASSATDDDAADRRLAVSIRHLHK